MVLGSRARQMRKANNLTVLGRLSKQCRILHISQPYKPPRLVTGVVLPPMLLFRFTI
jgi:hypothetical protein